MLGDEGRAIEVPVQRAGAQRMAVQADHHQRQHQGVDRVADIDASEFTLCDASANDAAEQLVGRLDHCAGIVLRDLREISHLGDHQLEHARGRAVVELGPPVDQHAAQQCPRAAFKPGCHVGAFSDSGRQVVADHRLEQVFLARVVAVQRAFGDTRMQGHLFSPGRRKAFLDKKLECCV